MTEKWTAEKVIKIQQMIHEYENIASLDTPLKNACGIEDEITLADFVQDTKNIEDELQQKFANKFLLECLSQLRPREAKVLELRYGLKDNRPKTLEEIAKIYGVVRERIRQVEYKALKHLKEIIVKKGIKNIHEIL